MFSVEAVEPGRGSGGRLVRAAIRVADPERPLFAAVAPGNAQSLHPFLAEGFAPTALEVVFEV